MFHLKDIVKSHGVLNIISYVRKSRQDIEREKRTGEDTLSEQKELMTRTLDSIELPYEMKMEIGSGDSIDGRPVFQQVIKDLESGKYQAIAVKELSRLSRGNMGDADRVINLLRDNRLLIITPTRVYDIRNTNDHRSIRFELFLAREEYEMIKERMVGARHLYASQGKWVAGASPYGYSYNKKTQRLVIDEEQAKVVRLIHDLFLNGLNGQEISYQAIATHLSNVGIKTPRGKNTWSYFQVKKILTNDLYIGVIRFRTHERNKQGKRIERPESEHIIVEDAHDPIIDKEQWYKVQSKINKKVVQPHNPLNFDPCELASICTCNVCGGKLIRNCGKPTYEKKNGEKSQYIKEFLKCQKNYCMSVKYRDIEEAILRYMDFIQELDESEIKEHFQSVFDDEENNSDDNQKDVLLQQIKQKEKELEQRMSFIFDKYEQGIYTDEIYLSRMNAIEEDKEKLEKEKNELDFVQNDIRKVDIDLVKTNYKTIAELYRSSTDKKEKNELLRLFFDHVDVRIIEKGRGRKSAIFEIHPRPNFIIIKEQLVKQTANP